MNKSLGFTTVFNRIIDGSDRAVTAIINERTVPIPTPLLTKASAIGRFQKYLHTLGYQLWLLTKQNTIYPGQEKH